MRFRSLLIVLLTALAALVAAPSGAFGAGTGGIDVSPDPGVVDGKQVTAFHVKVPSRGSVSVPFFLRNTTDAPVTGRLYAASATRDPKGQYAIGGPASAARVRFPTEDVKLAPREVRRGSFTVTGPVTDDEYAAIVVEVARGSITQRAATLVYVGKGRRVPVPVVLAGVAGVLLLLVGTGIALTRRRARRS